MGYAITYSGDSAALLVDVWRHLSEHVGEGMYVEVAYDNGEGLGVHHEGFALGEITVDGREWFALAPTEPGTDLKANVPPVLLHPDYISHVLIP